MNRKIRRVWHLTLSLAALTIFGNLSLVAQTASPATVNSQEQIYVVSAKAGGVSEIEGTARVKRLRGAGDDKVLEKGDELGALDRVNLEVGAKIEVMLNPGSYFRAGSSSEFEFIDTALESLKLNLFKGSALLEAVAVGGNKGAGIEITTPHALLELEKSGLYRVNISGEQTEIIVWKGAIRVGKELVKSGKQVVFSKGAATVIAKINKERMLDDLDLWSRVRAATLAKLNEQLERDALQRSFASYNNDYLSNAFTGYWVYDRRSGRWCYIPDTGARCCRSTYGHNYNHKIRVLRGEVPPDNPPIQVVTYSNSSDSASSDSSSSGSSSSPSSERADTSSQKSETTYSPPPAKSESAPPPPAEKSDPPAAEKSDSPRGKP